MTLPRLFALLIGLYASAVSAAPGNGWRDEWPRADFTVTAVDLAEIVSGGPPRDGIPAIDDPSFAAIDAVDLLDIEPVIGFGVGADMRAYSLHILIWHEIVNDVVGGEAWSLDLLRRTRRIVKGDMVITWEPEQASALDTAIIANGVDIGNVVVQRKTADGGLEDIPYGVDFAFAFRAFYPDAPIHGEAP